MNDHLVKKYDLMHMELIQDHICFFSSNRFLSEFRSSFFRQTKLRFRFRRQHIVFLQNPKLSQTSLPFIQYHRGRRPF